MTLSMRVFCGVMLMSLLLLCVTVCDGLSVGSPRRTRHLLSDSTVSWNFSTPSTPPVSNPTPTTPPVTGPKPGSGFGSAPGSAPIGNWFRCAPQFELVVFSVKENYTSASTSDIFSLETGELIGLAAGNCPNIEGTLSPTGSNLPLQECVFTYTFFNRGRLVETGTFDPSGGGVSNNAATGVDGEFFQALGLEHIENLADASGAIDTFYLCEVKNKNQNKNKNKHHNQHHKDGDNRVPNPRDDRVNDQDDEEDQP